MTIGQRTCPSLGNNTIVIWYCITPPDWLFCTCNCMHRMSFQKYSRAYHSQAPGHTGHTDRNQWIFFILINNITDINTFVQYLHFYTHIHLVGITWSSHTNLLVGISRLIGKILHSILQFEESKYLKQKKCFPVGNSKFEMRKSSKIWNKKEQEIYKMHQMLYR